MRLDQRVEPDLLSGNDRSVTRVSRRKTWHRRRAIAVALALTVLLGLLGYLRYGDGLRRTVGVVTADKPVVPSQKVMLADLWRVYKTAYLETGTGRTMDLQDQGITTSEAESYTMLRAVWMDDQKTFAESWQWTKDNLQRPDHLMAWKFGKRLDGSYGVQEEVGGGTSATDADVDIAFALLMGYSRWKQDLYLYDALPVISTVWQKSVVLVNGKPVLVADDLERSSPQKVLVNPSYFAPYAYRVFAKVDPQHDWKGLVDNSYALLGQLDQQGLGTGTNAGLPPDWVDLDRRTGEFSPVGAGVTTQTTRFGYDALRVPWRLALDYIWYREPRAQQLLEGASLLGRAWTDEHRLAASYDRDGEPAVNYEAPAMYGGAMGYFEVVRPDLGRQVYEEKLLPLYDPNKEDLTKPLSYYDSNWTWFGMALHLHELRNLNVTQE